MCRFAQHSSDARFGTRLRASGPVGPARSRFVPSASDARFVETLVNPGLEDQRLVVGGLFDCLTIGRLSTYRWREWSFDRQAISRSPR